MMAKPYQYGSMPTYSSEGAINLLEYLAQQTMTDYHLLPK